MGGTQRGKGGRRQHPLAHAVIAGTGSPLASRSVHDPLGSPLFGDRSSGSWDWGSMASLNASGPEMSDVTRGSAGGWMRSGGSQLPRKGGGGGPWRSTGVPEVDLDGGSFSVHLVQHLQRFKWLWLAGWALIFVGSLVLAPKLFANTTEVGVAGVVGS